MMTIINRQFSCTFEIDDELAAFMASHGFKPWHAGGGCFAWRRDLSFPNGLTPYDLINPGQDGLGSWAERDHPVWIAGRYGEEWSESPGELTLQEAINWLSMLAPGMPRNAEQL